MAKKIFSHYGKIACNLNERDQLLEEYTIEWIIFQKDSALVNNLLLTNDWKMVFEGVPFAVLVRKD